MKMDSTPKYRRVIARTIKTAAVCVALAALTAVSVSCSVFRTLPEDTLSSFLISCQPEECFKRAVALKEEGRGGDALDSFTMIRERFYGSQWSSMASLDLALLSLDESGAMARFYFNETLSITALEDYSYIGFARAWAREGRNAEAAAAFDYVIERHGDSALLPDALYERALALDSFGLTPEAVSLLDGFIKDYEGSKLIPSALLSKAQIHIRAGQREEALSALRRVLSLYPLDKEAVKAEELLSGILPGINADLLLSLDERFERGEVYFKAGRYNEAAKDLSYVARGGEGGRANSALLKLAVSRVRLKKYEGAKKAIKSYLYRKFPEKNEREALYWLSVIALREDDIYELENVDERLRKKHPESVERARSLIHIGRYYEWKKDFPNALEAYKEVMGRFNGEEAGEASWRAGWIYYRDERFAEALKTFKGRLVEGGYSPRRDQFLYWAGRTLEKTGRTKEASEYFARLCSESAPSYYCKMSIERRQAPDPVKGVEFGDALGADASPVEAPAAYMPAVSSNGNGGGDGNGENGSSRENGASSNGVMNADSGVPVEYGSEGLIGKGGNGNGDGNGVKDADEGPNKDKAVTGDRHYDKALILVMAGLKREASSEFDILLRNHRRDAPSLIEIGRLFYEGGDYRRALSVYWRHLALRGVGESGAVPELISASYPGSLVDKIRRIAPENSADPFLVAAVMREESGYNPDVVSWAGALGLMQIMPETGEKVANGLGMKPPNRDGLFDPETNIKIGARYLGSLLKRFNGDIVLAVAAYNAGPQAASRWAKNIGGETDEFIESIPYNETRYYVKKVLKSYSEFIRLYGDGKRGPALLTRDFAATATPPPPAPTAPPAISDSPAGAPGKAALGDKEPPLM